MVDEPRYAVLGSYLKYNNKKKAEREKETPNLFTVLRVPFFYTLINYSALYKKKL